MITASMATVAWRQPALEVSLPTILPQVDQLNVFVDGYDAVPDCLRDPKIHIVHGREHPQWAVLRSTSKLFWFAQGLVPDGIHLTVDDDILYPPTYVSYCAGKIERYGRQAIVGFHGGRFKEQVSHIYKDRETFHYEKECPADEFVHTIGSGTLAMHTSTLRLIYDDLLGDDAIDFRTAQAAQRQGVPMVCLARSAGYLRSLPLSDDERACSGRSDYLDRMLGFYREHSPWVLHAMKNALPPRPVVVVIPCYNESPDRVMKSAESALATPGVDLVRVIDDGSPVPLELPQHDRLVVIRRVTNGGPSAALNSGIKTLPDDAIVCRLDVGDMFYPEAKARQIAEVKSGKIRASFAWHYDPVRDFIRKPDENWPRAMYTDNQFGSTTAVLERTVWEEVGGYDEAMRWTDDWKSACVIQYLVGWHEFQEVAGEHGMYPGGHSDVAGDPAKAAARTRDMRKTVETARALAQPDKYKHLYDPHWCKKRGVVPLKRRNDR